MSGQSTSIILSRAAVPASVMSVGAAIVVIAILLPALVKVAGCVVLATVAFASWVGFRQNHRRNGEWPFNIGLLAASLLGLVGLGASLVG